MTEEAGVRIDGVPEVIRRDTYLQTIRSLGLDPADLRELHFGRLSVEAVVYARDVRGHRYVENGNPAVHRIRIAVVDR